MQVIVLFFFPIENEKLCVKTHKIGLLLPVGLILEREGEKVKSKAKQNTNPKTTPLKNQRNENKTKNPKQNQPHFFKVPKKCVKIISNNENIYIYIFIIQGPQKKSWSLRTKF